MDLWRQALTQDWATLAHLSHPAAWWGHTHCFILVDRKTQIICRSVSWFINVFLFKLFIDSSYADIQKYNFPIVRVTTACNTWKNVCAK